MAADQKNWVEFLNDHVIYKILNNFPYSKENCLFKNPTCIKVVLAVDFVEVKRTLQNTCHVKGEILIESSLLPSREDQRPKCVKNALAALSDDKFWFLLVCSPWPFLVLQAWSTWFVLWLRVCV